VTQYNHVYISPHLDDVVLSCGGAIWQQGESGETILVVTVFAGAPRPGDPLSPFAQQLHTRWGSKSDAVEARRREDYEALEMLGATGKQWTYPDCIYRQTPTGEFAYSSEDSLWGRIHPSENDLVDEISARLSRLPLAHRGTIYAPLGIGNHVDHQIVHNAAVLCGKPTLFYEDFPYARDPDAVCSRLAPGRWESHLTRISQHGLEAKIKAITSYRSQLSTFWENPQEMAADIRETYRRVGSGEPAERYWHQKA